MGFKPIESGGRPPGECDQVSSWRGRAKGFLNAFLCMRYFNLLIANWRNETKEKLSIYTYTHPHTLLVKYSSPTNLWSGKAGLNGTGNLSGGGEGRNSCQLVKPLLLWLIKCFSRKTPSERKTALVLSPSRAPCVYLFAQSVRKTSNDTEVDESQNSSALYDFVYLRFMRIFSSYIEV